MPRKPAAASKEGAPAPRRSPRVIPKPKPVKAPKAAAPKPKKAAAPKKAAPKSKRNASKRKSKPTYTKMITKALKELTTSRTGCGFLTIARYVESNYPVSLDSYKRYLRAALNNGVEDGLFAKTNQSFRLTAKGKADKRGRKRSTGSASTKTRSASKAESPSKRAKKAEPEAKESSRKKAEAPKKKAPRKAEAPKKVELARKKSNKSNGTTETSEEGVGSDPNAVHVVGSKYDHLWQFKDNHGWGNYEVRASDVLEEVYQGYLANRGDTDVRAVKSGQWEYQVDFMALKQTNIQHPNHTVRDIRRVKNTAALTK